MPGSDEGTRATTRGQRRGVTAARKLGVALPAFPGPLGAFQAVPRGRHEPRLYLGGDLHAVHPDAVEPPRGGAPDETLQAATVVVDDLEHESLWASADQGIWCIEVGRGMAGSAPYFSLFDSRGRLRHWLILPPARQMIGAGHLWLPFVRPWRGGEGGGPHPVIARRRRG